VLDVKCFTCTSPVNLRERLIRRLRQTSILIVSLWLFDAALEHTLMFWRANVFAANLCHALESRTYKEVTDRKSIKSPFGPGLTKEFNDSVNWNGIGWAETKCQYEVRFGDVFAPWQQKCKAITYTINIRPLPPGFPLMRMKYNLLGNFTSWLGAEYVGLLDLYVKGYSGKEPSRRWRYIIFLMRPFLCNPISYALAG
jgi:hypothetical protein